MTYDRPLMAVLGLLRHRFSDQLNDRYLHRSSLSSSPAVARATYPDYSTIFSQSYL
jgi:hypothetical protein